MRPFPFISNLSLNLAVTLSRKKHGTDNHEFVRLKIPDNTLPRLINVGEIAAQRGVQPPDQIIFVWLEDLIAARIGDEFDSLLIHDRQPLPGEAEHESIPSPAQTSESRI